MERLKIPDEKIEGGVRRTVIDSKFCPECGQKLKRED